MPPSLRLSSPSRSTLLPSTSARSNLSAIATPCESCCNTLRKLLRWSTDGGSKRAFRIEVDVVGEAMLVTRWGGTVEPASAGYGHPFEKKMRRTESASGFGGESTGHHRIVSFVRARVLAFRE